MSEEIALSPLETYLGKEFYLMVEGEDTEERIHDEVERYKVANRTPLGGLLSRMSKERPPIKMTGSLMEIKSREPGNLEPYLWPDVDGIHFEDGTSVGSTIPPDEVYRGYIFLPTAFSPLPDGGLSIVGTVSPYELHDNSVGVPLEKKVVVTYNALPKCKYSGGSIACL
ncbi:MAG: hypothetical protein V2A62_00305 [Candidatus Woesearchaeota archaeon]